MRWIRNNAAALNKTARVADDAAPTEIEPRLPATHRRPQLSIRHGGINVANLIFPNRIVFSRPHYSAKGLVERSPRAEIIVSEKNEIAASVTRVSLMKAAYIAIERCSWLV